MARLLPGLGRAGHWVKGRAFPKPTLQPAEELRQPVQFHHAAHVEQGEQNFPRQILEAVSCKPARDQGIVMGPDRAVVVRKRVVTSFSGGQGADSPSAEEIGPKQSVCSSFSPLRTCDTRVQAVARVRRAYPAGPFLAVKRQGVSAKVFAPEGFLEMLAELSSLRLQR